jgi:uncharacterized protein (TIGR02466 family)
MTQHLIFPTVIHTHYIEPNNDTKILKDIITRTNKEPHLLLKSAPSTYGTTQTLLNNPLLTDFKRHLTTLVNTWAKELDISELEITNSWANILGPGHRVDYHRHPRSVVSAAYYLQAPKGSIDLEFTNPLLPYRQCETFLYQHLYKEPNFLNQQLHTIPCEENLIVLFPSWLEHGSSHTNQSTDRITVSFNTYYRDK